MKISESHYFNRRQFHRGLARVAGILGISKGLGGFANKATAASSPNEMITIGVMGLNGRGSDLTRGFLNQPNVRIAYVCDVDSRAVDKGMGLVAEKQRDAPQGVSDFRRILDDPSVDALICAAPNHWHAPATIAACCAGKHVYVEKPCSHTPWEGEMAVEAARKYKRVVQMGNQRRSSELYQDAIGRLHRGTIGKIHYARCWYNSRRGPIGKGKATTVPEWLDYSLWQGPCTEKPFRDNILHYNWHWFWHWGNGELGNNGVHGIDIARWGLGVDFPQSVGAAGGRYRFDDDQETFDTHVVTFEFESSMLVWEGLSWSPRDRSRSMFGISFHGEDGTMELGDDGFTILDMQNKIVEQVKGQNDDSRHFANFLEGIRSGEKLSSGIEEAHKSTLLCHLGNIAKRSQSVVETDPENGHLKNAELHSRWWSKEYRSGWEPKIS